MNVCYLCRKSPLLILVNPIYNLQSYSFNIHFKIIFPPNPKFSNRTFSFRLPYQYFLSNSLCSHACHVHRKFTLLTLIVLVISRKHYSSTVQRSEIKWSEVNEAKWSGMRRTEVQYREGGRRVFMEKVHSSKWWEVKDWGESVIGLKKKQLQETVHSTLLLGCFCLLYMLYSNLTLVFCT